MRIMPNKYFIAYPKCRWFCILLYCIIVVVVIIGRRRESKSCSENEPCDKGLSIVHKGRSHSRNDDVIVSYHCYQECNDDTVLKTMPKYTPILCYAIQLRRERERE